MYVWLLAVLLALLAAAALFYAGRNQSVNASGDNDVEAEQSHQRALLEELDEDRAAGRISQADAEAARVEIAREALRIEKVSAAQANRQSRSARWAMVGAAAGVAVLSLGLYAVMGQPQLPGEPLTSRPIQIAKDMSLNDAIARVEARLVQSPNDLRGWKVIAPIYVKVGRYTDAVRAYKNVLRLETPVSPNTKVDLAEAMIMARGGVAAGEPLQLLQQAVAEDPSNSRGRFYIAGEATRAGDFTQAVKLWTGLIDSASGKEGWLPVARQGLQFAEARLNGTAPAAPVGQASAPVQPAAGGNGQLSGMPASQQELIKNMVAGLADRLANQGGSVDEWLRLVRSRLVLGDKAQAQKDYEAAKAAYPDPAKRVELDRLAQQNGLS